MTQQHPITPPPELIYEWAEDRELLRDPLPLPEYIANRAAQWGADQELEACCALMDDWGLDGEDLMQCRRPKPQTLKEQALETFDKLQHLFEGYGGDGALIRRALEQLPNNN
jgi:hypothetical protein